MSELTLTTRTLRFLSLRIGELSVDDRDGLLIPVMVNGDGPIIISITELDSVSCLPHVERINGVRYDVAWWLSTTGGNPHGYTTSGGYRDRAIRVQRVGSDHPTDRTDAAFALAARLMYAIVESVTSDAEVMRQASLVAAERAVIARQITYDRALAELNKAETALRSAEETWDRLSDGDELAMVAPGAPTPAIAAAAERQSA